MKKLVFMFVAVVAVSFVSCGDAPKKVAETVDSVATEVAEEVEEIFEEDSEFSNDDEALAAMEFYDSPDAME